MTAPLGWDRATSVAQLHQVLQGWELVERTATGYRTTDALRRLLAERGGVGAIYGLFRTDPWSGRDASNGVVPEARAEVAELVQAEVRAATGGIGALLTCEATHGELVLGAVTLPTNLAQAATWDPGLVQEAADAVGRAVRADGSHLAFISGADMLRDPRWGRSEETFGEDPMLASAMVSAQVAGMQGGLTLAPETHPGVVIKHVAGQGGAVGGRNAVSAALGPVELAEVHLPPVAAAIRAGAVGVMAAYNDIDGTPCVLNRWLLTDLLRGEYGFDGVVMADALAIDRAGESLGARRAARLALRAGCDLNLGDAAWSALDEPGDAADELALTTAAARVYAVKERFGLLPGQVAATPSRPEVREVIELSGSLARACVTALASVAPVEAGASILVTGPFAASVESLLGDYSPPVEPGRFRSLADAVAARFASVTVVDWRSPELTAAAAGADVVVVQLGGTSERRYGAEFAATGANLAGEAEDGLALGSVVAPHLPATCGEGVDVAALELPHGQDAWLRRLRAATRARVIGVAVMGRPHILRTAAALCDDLLVAWYPGPFGGDAVAEVLAGDAVPAGRLPVTLLADAGAVGWHADDRVGRVEAPWADLPEPVLAGFGTGAAGEATVDAWSAERDPATGTTVLDLTVRVAEGTSEVVQVFGRRLGGRRWPRRRILLGFERVRGPGPHELRFELTDDEVFGTGPARSRLPAPDDSTSCVLTVEPFGVTATIERTKEP